MVEFVQCVLYILPLLNHYMYLKSSPVGLVLEFEMRRYFDTKQKYFTMFDYGYPAQTYLQPHYANGVFGIVYLSARQH